MTRILKLIFWPIFIVTMGVYAAMLFWSLPAITAAAGGLTPFDLRPSGYTFEEAKTFLAALPQEANDFYRHTQIAKLDTAYPGLLALTLFLAIGLLAQNWLKLWGWALAPIAIPGAVFDYMENVNVRLMLFLGPDNINAEIVERASSRSEAKAMFTTIAMTVLLILLIMWVIRWVRHKRAQNEA